MRQLEELVMAAIAGDKSAFRELLEREAHKVYIAALAVAGSPEEARDAVQEATLRAWQRLPELRDSAAWPAWFRQIAVRAAIDGRRRSRNVRELRLVEAGHLAQADPSAERDEVISVMAAIQGLGHAERALLGLRYGADLTVPEAAAALGINLGTAKSKLHRALVKLRSELDDGH